MRPAPSLGHERTSAGRCLNCRGVGQEPIVLDDGSERTFLLDGDDVSHYGMGSGYATGRRIGFGSVERDSDTREGN